MPEGPEIRRAADTLEAAIKGEPLTEAWFAFPQLQPYQTQLIGQRVTHIATRGKALLTHFSGGLTLYSHNQLYGVWRVVDAGVEPQSNRVLRVRLQTASKAILLYSASDIDILTAEQVANHPFLQRVGPDVLDMTLTAEQVKARLLSAKFRNRYSISRGCPIVLAVWWMTTSIMARCFALRSSIAMGKGANAVGESLRRRRSPRGHFTGVQDASIKPAGGRFQHEARYQA